MIYEAINWALGERNLQKISTDQSICSSDGSIDKTKSTPETQEQNCVESQLKAFNSFNLETKGSGSVTSSLELPSDEDSTNKKSSWKFCQDDHEVLIHSLELNLNEIFSLKSLLVGKPSKNQNWMSVQLFLSDWKQQKQRKTRLLPSKHC